jgi:NAD+ synthase (glutamine-hydrolysing)
MRVALLQLNFIVGDIEGNCQKIVKAVREAETAGVDLCITSELSLLGYPPRDMLLYAGFIDLVRSTVDRLALQLKDAPPVLIGTVERNTTGKGKALHNAAVLIHEGEIKSTFYKSLLPTYDVFDEDRYFSPGQSEGIAVINGMRIGVTICEDIWNDKDFWEYQRYWNDPVEHLTRSGHVDCLVNISGSPFTVGKQEFREKMLKAIATKYNAPICYVNQVGGNDDLVFDGRSCAVDAGGTLIAKAKSFEEDILIVDLESASNRMMEDDFSIEAEAWNALVLGTRDYIFKCGFKSVLLGLSGGIDSALTAAIAAEAIGKENVLGVMMPSMYSSQGSIDDSIDLAHRLGIRTELLPIKQIMSAFDDTLKPLFINCAPDTTEENIQSRIRGGLLMSLSNKFKAMLLSTGNKSEISVGYCTIYGDMNGGLAVLADVPKTLVYRLSEWANIHRGDIIPRSIIDKAPSAELRPDQKDQDSLPPYDVLDNILLRYLEQHSSKEEIIACGFDRMVVDKILRLVKSAEFKRKQSPPGIKITDRAFGTGWRMPIASRMTI